MTASIADHPAGVQGVMAGVVASFGALIAHTAAGGEDAALPPVLLVLCLTLPLAVVLARLGRNDLRALTTVALVAQTIGHLSLGVTPGGHHGAVMGVDLLDTAAMFGTHLVVAIATVALAAGYGHALVDASRSFLGRLLRRVSRSPRLLAWRRPVLRGAGWQPVVGLTRRPQRPRGPPTSTCLPPRPTFGVAC